MTLSHLLRPFFERLAKAKIQDEICNMGKASSPRSSTLCIDYWWERRGKVSYFPREIL